MAPTADMPRHPYMKVLDLRGNAPMSQDAVLALSNLAVPQMMLRDEDAVSPNHFFLSVCLSVCLSVSLSVCLLFSPLVHCGK